MIWNGCVYQIISQADWEGMQLEMSDNLNELIVDACAELQVPCANQALCASLKIKITLLQCS